MPLGFGFPIGEGEVPIGVVLPYLGADNDIPEKWLLCNGQTVDAGRHPELFIRLKNAYAAGTAITVPDMRGRIPVGKDNMGGTSANIVTGAWADQFGGTSGAETHTLSTTEMPAHTHPVGDGAAGATSIAQGNAQTTNSAAYITGSAGSGSAHNNIQPSFAMNYIIKALS